MNNTVNADPAELAKFSDLAHRWWDIESEFRPLHMINPLRLEWINSLCAVSGARALDVGCGGGILADSMEMLEHVPDPSSVVKACAALVKPGGWAFFSTINRNPKSFLLAIVGAEYILNMLPRGTHEYAKMIRPSELAGYCRQSGLDLRQTSGMQYNPITKRYWMSADTDVNYLFATQKSL